MWINAHLTATFRGMRRSAVSPSGMSEPRTLRGIELRYALTMYLAQHGPHTVAELIEALTHQGFRILGRPSKAVSDALRWEIAHDRVRRRGWGRYGPGALP